MLENYNMTSCRHIWISTMINRMYQDPWFPSTGRVAAILFAKSLNIYMYSNYPVIRWRKLFKEIESQLKEIDSTMSTVDIVNDTEESRDQKQNKLASTEPGFEFTVESKKIIINYNNITKVTVSYYAMDIGTFDLLVCLA